MNPRNRSSALMALLTAGGLWAWQNRDKVKAFVEQQRSSMSQRQGVAVPMTGETRRISYEDTLGTPASEGTPGRTYDPSI